ncbi:MAG: helix-turn-helix transcriptional regulator [Desulfovibrio sp.]|uniref:AraC family transcriptional regulator n=1 Tax=Desulfovibrio sp. 7SRBS1 TaxID=3378064 RepID=UPI003B3E94D3
MTDKQPLSRLQLTPSLDPHFDFSLESPGVAESFTTLKGVEIVKGVTLHHITYSQESMHEYAFVVSQSPFSLDFCCQGRAAINIRTGRRKSTHIMHSPSTCTLSYLPEAHGEWIPLTKECTFCTLQINPHLFTELWTSVQDNLPPEMTPLARQQDPMPFFTGRQAPPAVHMAVRDLVSCPPMQDSARELFLGCKIMEILLLLTTQPSQQNAGGRSPIPLSQGDLSRIYQAREILEDQLDAPPTLPQLARLTGLNEFKLKRGFRQVFATTPYNHLRTTRMNKAREYIEKGEMNVCEACMAVGYSNLGNFIDLFKKHFGTTPGGLRKSALRAARTCEGNA